MKNNLFFFNHKKGPSKGPCGYLLLMIFFLLLIIDAITDVSRIMKITNIVM